MDFMLSTREITAAQVERDVGRHERLWHLNRKLYYSITERTDHCWSPGSPENIRRKQTYVNLFLAMMGEL